jgi:hypothetical protein
MQLVVGVIQRLPMMVGVLHHLAQLVLHHHSLRRFLMMVGEVQVVQVVMIGEQPEAPEVLIKRMTTGN